MITVRAFILFLLMAAMSAVELDELLEKVDPEFQQAVEALSKDREAIARLRAQPIVGSEPTHWRKEILRRIILAQIDAPQAFESYAEMLVLNQPGSPLRKKEGPEDTEWSFLLQNNYWRVTPIRTGEWLIPQNQRAPLPPDSPYITHGYWPAIAFGLAGQPRNWRWGTFPIFQSWSEGPEAGSELVLESMLWLCERTDNQGEVVELYARKLHHDFLAAPNVDKARFVTRFLHRLDRGIGIEPTNVPGVESFIGYARQYGVAQHAAELRRLAEQGKWSPFREKLLKAATAIEHK